ncbi:hypothetical protein FLK61_24420 [Paenalkalicoccus suaedae]|uniref:Uncharacterized protein n=1 Tax=Paenalkalicoccus suaedae TaxID=2592382 RepID=A0A859F9W1_9BACI|nr:hypothetical protein [Paenalkalicoccus suaedae]QKS69929.1 hypothetical protein FLK61_24420 [Paenalkalicoccus suaedae]
MSKRTIIGAIMASLLIITSLIFFLVVRDQISSVTAGYFTISLGLLGLLVLGYFMLPADKKPLQVASIAVFTVGFITSVYFFVASPAYDIYVLEETRQETLVAHLEAEHPDRDWHIRDDLRTARSTAIFVVFDDEPDYAHAYFITEEMINGTTEVESIGGAQLNE